MFAITNGKNYIGSKNNATTLACAVTFKSREEADGFLANMPRAFRNLGYHVQEMKVEGSGDVELVKKNSGLSYDMPKSKYMEDSMRVFETFYEFFKEFKDQREKFAQDLRDADQEILDIEHAIEFLPNLNCPKAYNLYKLLKKARIKRREAKDAIFIIDVMNQQGFNGLVSGKTISIIKKGDHRMYSPRILKEIFE